MRRCRASVMGAEPQRAKRRPARLAGSNGSSSMRAYIVGTPVMMVGRNAASRPGMSSARNRPASATLAPARSGAKIWLLNALV
ncbi:hypothetical protein D3C72_1964870 [compost metagenome]